MSDIPTTTIRVSTATAEVFKGRAKRAGFKLQAAADLAIRSWRPPEKKLGKEKTAVKPKRKPTIRHARPLEKAKPAAAPEPKAKKRVGRPPGKKGKQ